MRSLRLIVLLWLAGPGAAVAGEPSDIKIIGWTHYFMVGCYWAVAGEVARGALTGYMSVQSYVAAVRQFCEIQKAPECWRLEKLAVEGRILFDWGRDL